MTDRPPDPYALPPMPLSAAEAASARPDYPTSVGAEVGVGVVGLLLWLPVITAGIRRLHDAASAAT
jgi:uncharacterized membrane protein YhaH (DUF805 family)